MPSRTPTRIGGDSIPRIASDAAMLCGREPSVPESDRSDEMPGRKLKVGYLLQYDPGDMSAVSAWGLHIRAIVDGLTRRGHHVRMVALRNGRPHYSDDLVTWHPADLRSCNSRLFRVLESCLRGVQSRLRLPYFNLFDSYRFSEACVSALEGCDVLYERYWLINYGGLFASKRLRVPLILELNGDLLTEYAQEKIHLSAAQWGAVHLINRLLFKYVDRVVCVTEPLRRRTIALWHVDPSKVFAVQNGARVELFASPSPSEEIRSKFCIGSEPIVAFVGSFRGWHGIDLVLDAFALVAATHPTVRLFLIGDGPLRPELEAKVDVLGLRDRVIFTGKLDQAEVAALLQHVAITVMSPRSSGASAYQSPLKLFEYMAAGKAVVAPRIASIQSVLSDRVNALLVPPDDVDALAEALMELVEDAALRETLGRAAQHQALERHSWSHTTTQLESVALGAVRSRRLSEIVA